MRSIGNIEQTERLISESVRIGIKQAIDRPFIEVALAVPEFKELLLSHPVSDTVRMGLALMSSQPPSNSEYPEDEYSLSKREMEVIRLVRSGLQNKEVADRLNISEITVKSHLTRVFKKMKVKNRVQMIKKSLHL